MSIHFKFYVKTNALKVSIVSEVSIRYYLIVFQQLLIFLELNSFFNGLFDSSCRFLP